MRQIRLREARKQKGMSVRALAELAGVDHTAISRIERGERGMSVEMAEKLANALNESTAHLLGIEQGPVVSPAGQLSEEAEPYSWPDTDQAAPIAIKRAARENIVTFLIKSGTLDNIDFRPGDIVFVDIGQAAVDSLKPSQCVVAQHYSGLSARTIVRQFIPPSMLITNSRTENGIGLNLETDDVAIKGVIIGQYKARTS